MTGIETANAYILARLADCASPDTLESPGAEFLLSIAREARDAWQDMRGEDDRNDRAHEIADGAVPIYTRDVWTTFVDLAAYQEDPTELGATADDMEQAAKVCLYMIGERLALAVWDDMNDDDDHDDDDDDDDDDDTADGR